MRGRGAWQLWDLLGETYGAFADGEPLPEIDPWLLVEDDSEEAVDLRKLADELTRIVSWEPWPGPGYAPNPSVRATTD